MKKSIFLSGIWLVLIAHTGIFAQSLDDFPEMRLRISSGQYTGLLQSKGRKLTLKNPVLIVHGDTAKVKEIHSRGNNSLTFEHKSLSVDLNHAVKVLIGGKATSLKKFDLLNLVMDKNLWHNRWAFLCMQHVSLFPLVQTYSPVWINDQPQGIYLLVEKPRHYITSAIKSPYLLRRGIDHTVADEYIETPSKDEAKKYKAQFTSVYDDINKLHGQSLYDRLNAKVNLDHYFKWIAFNYLIMNGDYADELYLYISPNDGRYEVIPWDYDDILRPVPHEGMAARNAVEGFKSKYIFSSEDPLDRAIAADEVLYAHYLESFKDLLTNLDEATISRFAFQVRGELHTLGAGDQGRASLFLGKEPWIEEEAMADMDRSLDFILKRRNALLKELQK
ncbi:MAG TPA: CotH kinase family protein [Cyclobacteriaceae bacterium]|nr:CotH kinase family protein [Cyclobacteriaceae bacterium]